MTRPRRARGEGTITQLGPSLWRGQISLGFDRLTGKRDRRAVYGKTRAEVVAKLAKLRTEIEAGKVQARGRRPTGSTLAEYLTRWLADAVKPRVRTGTYAIAEQHVRTHIVPAIGALKLERVGPLDVAHLNRIVADSGAGARTRRGVHVTLARALKQAVRWDMLPSNPAERVDAPRYEAPPATPLEAKAVGKMLKAAVGDRLEALYMLALATGMRQGELFGLQWVDVDLATASVAVRHTLAYAGKTPVLGEPKTRASRRRVLLGARAKAALDRHRKRMMAEGHGSTYVFCNPDGSPLHKSNFIRRAWRPLLEKAELPSTVRFHDLRHTTATLMLRANVHPKIVQELLGHAKIATTMDTYSHVAPAMQAQAIGALDRTLARARTASRLASQPAKAEAVSGKKKRRKA